MGGGPGSTGRARRPSNPRSPPRRQAALRSGSCSRSRRMARWLHRLARDDKGGGRLHAAAADRPTAHGHESGCQHDQRHGRCRDRHPRRADRGSVRMKSVRQALAPDCRVRLGSRGAQDKRRDGRRKQQAQSSQDASQMSPHGPARFVRVAAHCTATVRRLTGTLPAAAIETQEGCRSLSRGERRRRGLAAGAAWPGVLLVQPPGEVGEGRQMDLELLPVDRVVGARAGAPERTNPVSRRMAR